MKRSHAKISMFLVLLTSVVLLSTTASAQIAPYLYFGGNYQYDVDTKQLTFTDNYADFLEFDGGEYDFDTDPIIGATLSFGSLTNSTSNPLVFSSSTFKVDGYFEATLDNFVITSNPFTDENGDIQYANELSWGSLSNIQRLDSGTSRYVNELLANGGGIGNIYMSFTPQAGGTENFTANSYGATGGMVAAPEPISAILFVAGGLTLGFRSYRKRRIQ